MVVNAVAQIEETTTQLCCSISEFSEIAVALRLPVSLVCLRPESLDYFSVRART
jgi:hypothetical protein